MTAALFIGESIEGLGIGPRGKWRASSLSAPARAGLAEAGAMAARGLFPGFDWLQPTDIV
jgi:hypothetical protein